MGLMDGLLGNASELEANKVESDYQHLFVNGEKVDSAFIVIRDVFIFTNKRIVLVDKQGLSGKKAEFLSIPYSKVTKFSCETSGTFDMDSDLKIWVGSEVQPIERKISNKIDIKKFYQSLSCNILNSENS